jgi:hypothetical protein
MAREQNVETQRPLITQTAAQEGVQQEAPKTLPTVPDTSGEVQSGMRPRYPAWPTSKPGPRVTPLLPGMRAINAFRPEQGAEIAYNQETGEPSVESPARSLPDEAEKGPVSFDEKPKTGQGVLGKRKQRL